MMEKEAMHREDPSAGFLKIGEGFYYRYCKGLILKSFGRAFK